MTTQILGPRKRRTRQHVIADLSVHHVERFVLEEGHSVQRLGSDYSYDLLLRTFDDNGYAEPGLVYIQVKAAESLQLVGSEYVFDVDIRDYNLWVREEMPVILMLFDVSKRKAFWLAVQAYFRKDPARRPKQSAKSIRVKIPRRQIVNRRAIQSIRELKQIPRPQLGRA